MNYKQILLESGVLTPENVEKIQFYEQSKKFSLHTELQTLLYIGVLLFTTGAGILIYLNIDTIGHQVIIAVLAAMTVGCFYYCQKHSPSFSFAQITHESPFFQYVVLAGALLFLILEGYIQYQYQIFGDKYDLAAIIPTILFFYLSYRFDHLGVLSLAITGLGAWLGITITPLDLFNSNNFSSENIIFTGLGLGLFLGTLGYFLNQRSIKPHFTFTYLNFSMHLLFISALSGLFVSDWKILYVVLLAGFSTVTYIYAKREVSFYFLIVMVLYSYVGITYLVFRWMDGESMVSLGFYYFIFSCFGLILFLKNYRKFLKVHDSVQ